jgi:hypothetical protein
MQMQAQQQQTQMQAQQQAMQMAQMKKEVEAPTQEQVEISYIQQKAASDSANISIKAMDAETKRIDVLSKIQNAHVDREVKIAEMESSNTRHAVDAVVELSKRVQEKSSKENANG